MTFAIENITEEDQAIIDDCVSAWVERPVVGYNRHCGITATKLVW